MPFRNVCIYYFFEMENDKTYEIHVTENGVEKLEYPKILSRGKDIMPVVEKSFCKLKRTESRKSPSTKSN